MIGITEFNQALATAITPITLISGVGLLMICMTGRYNHATNRIRQLMAKRESASRHLEPDIDAEIDLIFLRASLLRRGMLCVGLSAVCSALLVVTSVASAFLDSDLLVAEAVFLVGAISLIVTCALLFSAEINLSLHALKLAVDHLPPLPAPKAEESADAPAPKAD